MVGCGSSARVANSPNAILPPALAMISSSSNARSTDCTPDLVDDSSATGTLRSSIRLATPLSDKLIPYYEIIRESTAAQQRPVCGMSQPQVSAHWILATVCYEHPVRDQKGSS